MKNTFWIPALALALAGFVFSGCSGSQSPSNPAAAPSGAQAGSPVASVPSPRPVPPFYGSAEAAKPFPRLLPAAYFRQYPLVARAYKVASDIPEVFAQQPCYCFCDKSGHRSLLDCYASDHGAGCLICIKEALLADQMHKKGKTATEIRTAIIRGDWRLLKLDQF